jgi:hypothetical protein
MERGVYWLMDMKKYEDALTGAAHIKNPWRGKP